MTMTSTGDVLLIFNDLQHIISEKRTANQTKLSIHYKAKGQKQ